GSGTTCGKGRPGSRTIAAIWYGDRAKSSSTTVSRPLSVVRWKRGPRTTDEILKQPVYIPRRPKKDPRAIKILDPDCGSGHFLLYCFGLLLVIYEEAYDDIDLGSELQADYATKDDFRRAL